VFYGLNVETALEIVRSMRFVTDVFATLNSAAAEAVLTRLRSSPDRARRGIRFTRVARHRATRLGPGLTAERHAPPAR
jgi:hypothetical protein